MLLSAAQEPHIESLCEEILLNEEPNVPFRRSRKRYYQIDADLQSQVEVGWRLSRVLVCIIYEQGNSNNFEHIRLFFRILYSIIMLRYASDRFQSSNGRR